MTYKEALKAMKSRDNVIVNDIVYKRINAIIFRKTDEQELIEAELQDMNTNSVIICELEKIKPVD